MSKNTRPIATHINWPTTHRIIRSRFPPIDLFEDIADPSDWQTILSAEAKTNPRMAESTGMLDLVPEERRVGGDGASWTMGPFVHVSPDRPSRFSDGTYGVYYAGDRTEVAIFETIHHHTIFMTSTNEEAGWTSDFRELVGSLDAEMHDISNDTAYADCHKPNDYRQANTLAKDLREHGSNGIIYNSVRFPEGKCLAAFWPDVVGIPMQAQHFSYYWDGTRVSRVRNPSTGDVFDVKD